MPASPASRGDPSGLKRGWPCKPVAPGRLACVPRSSYLHTPEEVAGSLRDCLWETPLPSGSCPVRGATHGEPHVNLCAFASETGRGAPMCGLRFPCLSPPLGAYAVWRALWSLGKGCGERCGQQAAAPRCSAVRGTISVLVSTAAAPRSWPHSPRTSAVIVWCYSGTKPHSLPGGWPVTQRRGWHPVPGPWSLRAHSC